MKKLLLLSFLIASSSMLIGQRAAKFYWFDVGAKVQYGGAMLWNQAVNDSQEFNYDIGSGYSVGGKIGLNKGTNGFTIDVMGGSANQNFEDNADMTNNIRAKWNYLDLYPLYRNNRQLGYVEIGPKFSFIQSVENTVGEGGSSDVTKSYEGTNIGAVLGFGAYFIGSDNRFSGIFGVRVEYGITDVVNSDGHVDGYPVVLPTLNDNGVTSTHPVFAGLVFELNWGLGYYGKASCGGRSKFIKF